MAAQKRRIPDSFVNPTGMAIRTLRSGARLYHVTLPMNFDVRFFIEHEGFTMEDVGFRRMDSPGIEMGRDKDVRYLGFEPIDPSPSCPPPTTRKK